MYKQVIIMRKDLNMRKGKMVAQGAHASLKAILDLMIHITIPDSPTSNRVLVTDKDSPLDCWLSGSFKKICVSVNSEEELMYIYNKAKEQNIICSLIEDSGVTEFHDVITKTCCAIGPDKSSKIDEITEHLKLL